MKAVILAMLFCLLFNYEAVFFFKHRPNDFLKSHEGEKIELIGKILSEPIEKPKSTQLIATTEYGKVLLFANSYPKVSYGDEILFKAKLKRPESFETDSGKIFNYPGYLSKDRIYFIESYPSIKILSSHNGNPIKEKLYDLKYQIAKGMEKVVPYPESALLEGITIAGKRSLSEEINDQFKKAGVSHIVVLSGYNVTIIALIIMSILKGLGRNIAFWGGTISIILFCLMVGATSTIVRAGIMSFLFILARFSRREADANRLLFLTGGIMIFLNPLILLFDPSFHLSFLATFALINVTPLFERTFYWLKGMPILKEIAATSLAVELFLIPYICYSIGFISTFSLGANTLLLAFIPITMLFGFLSGVFSYFSILLAKIPALLSFLLLRYELGIVRIVSSVDFQYIKITVPWWFTAIFYLDCLLLFAIHQIVSRRQANLDSQKRLLRTSSYLPEYSQIDKNAPTYRGQG